MTRTALALVRDSLASLPPSAQGDPEQVRRAERFRARNPDVMLLARFSPPRACVDGELYVRGSLRSLMNALEQLRPPPDTG